MPTAQGVMEQASQPRPLTAPFDTRTIDVGEGHTIYVEQVGDPGGLPAVFLHGGPGSGCQPGQRRLFHPDRFRAVRFCISDKRAVFFYFRK